jgi:hypothetical protein
VLEPQDDPDFLAIVDRIILRLVRRQRPEEVYLVHIDNWFGPKWLKYSGRGVVAFPDGYAQDTVVALDDHYQDHLTFPPFSRNRVVAQNLFRHVGEGEYEEQAPEHLVHRTPRRRKEQSLHRRVADFSQSGLFIWYSSGSRMSRRASVLAYGTQGGAVTAWYAGFSERQGWQLDQVKGISRDAVAALMAEEA